jgi:hypothetical protein
VSEGLQAAGAAVAVEWPRPLPVLLAPAPNEALSSWMARHAAFYGTSRTALLRHCVPDVPSPHLLNRALTPEQERRLAHLFRLGRPALRRMTHAELDPDAIGQLVAHEVDHWCEPCARSLAEAGFSKAVLRIWFHTWRITCPHCGARVLPSWRTIASLGDTGASSNLFPSLWAKALEGERLLDAVVHRTATAVPLIPPMQLLRLLMIWTGCEQVPANGERQRQGWTLDAVVPGFDTALERHGIEVPRTTRISVPLPVRTALLAGFALATENPAMAIPAMWARTSGMHRAHFRYVLTDMPGGLRLRPLIAS